MLSVMMLNVTYKPYMLSVVMLNVVILSTVMLNVVMLMVVPPIKQCKFYSKQKVLQDRFWQLKLLIGKMGRRHLKKLYFKTFSLNWPFHIIDGATTLSRVTFNLTTQYVTLNVTITIATLSINDIQHINTKYNYKNHNYFLQ